MNLMTLTNMELINYLDKHSSDPVVLKLVNFFLAREEGIVAELEQVGMDPDGTFVADRGDSMTPAEYITHLQNENAYYINESDEFRVMYEQSVKRIKELEARTVAELITELNNEVRSQDLAAIKAIEQRDKAYADRAQMQSKLSMWAKLNGQL